jgi:hypothetical protein
LRTSYASLISLAFFSAEADLLVSG